MVLSVGGLFSGIGGIELGLERAGMRIAWHCESDPYARRVLEAHWPGVPCYEDVCALSGAAVQPVDVLCGGFPCQDISLAGAGAGIDGDRSGLWREYARLVGELRPRYVVVENVAALLARGLGRVLGDLAALGYDAEWDCVPASAVGAPHQRDRVWLVAYPDSQGQPGHPVDAQSGCGVVVSGGAHVADAQRFTADQQPDAAMQRGWQDDAEQAGLGGSRSGAVANTEREGLQGLTGSREPRARWASVVASWRDEGLRGQWIAEPDVGRVAHGVPARVDRLRCLGNAVVPQIPELIGRRIIEWEAA